MLQYSTKPTSNITGISFTQERVSQSWEYLFSAMLFKAIWLSYWLSLYHYVTGGISPQLAGLACWMNTKCWLRSPTKIISQKCCNEQPLNLFAGCHGQSRGRASHGGVVERLCRAGQRRAGSHNTELIYAESSSLASSTYSLARK